MSRSTFDKIRDRLSTTLDPWFREHVICPYKRRRLTNHNASIFCNNCVGATISHDLGLQFHSPFVNLWLYPKDYIKFCENINHYISCSLQFVSSQNYDVDYPVATLDDITIFFQHYHTEKDAESCWERRKKRINFENIRCLLIERDGCTKEDLLRFSQLPYFTASLVHKQMKDVANTHYISGFEKDGEVGNSIEYKKCGFYGFRYYDDFDYVSFING